METSAKSKNNAGYYQIIQFTGETTRVIRNGEEVMVSVEATVGEFQLWLLDYWPHGLKSSNGI
nr:hypothetical protein [Virgibacillus phasianinus]